MRYGLITFMGFLLGVNICFSQNLPVKRVNVHLPSFIKYKIGTEYGGVPAKIDFSSDLKMRLFRTAIRTCYKNSKLTFAGHYRFASWGCGSECQASAIVDLTSGKVYDGIDASLGYQFKANSRMVIVNPLNTKGEIDDFCMDCIPEV